MKYRVVCGNYLLLDTQIEALKLVDPTLELELNKTGSFTFTIYPDHPNFERIQKLKPIITVYQDEIILFRGRILNDEVGWHNERQVTCEGELAFLLDSVQRPFVFPVSDTSPATPEAYLRFLLANHNKQVDEEHQFKLGNVTVKDDNDYIARSDTEYSATWDLINQGLISTHGGYLWVRHEADGNYLDYLADFSTLSNQPIEFGRNLLDLKKERKGEDIVTGIVPIGATLTEDVTDETTGETKQISTIVTISDLDDETTDNICKSGDCIFSKAAQNTYGKIFMMIKWENVTEPTNLLRKAKQKLAKSILLSQSIELTAADLSAAGQDFNAFRLGRYVKTTSKPHDLSENYLIKKLSIKLMNPADNKLTLGETFYSFTEDNRIKSDETKRYIDTNIEKSRSQTIVDLERKMDAKVTATEGSILSTVSDIYYSKEDGQELMGKWSEFEQAANGWEMRFNSLNTDLKNYQSGTDSQFELIQKYIQFKDGDIILGQKGNKFGQRISNNKNSFYEDGAEVAYFSGRKLNVYDGEFINSLKLGKFAFLPRANGNLSFKKVVE